MMNIHDQMRIAWTIDIDECVSNPCHPNATCTNKNGTFTCECDAGYMGDGFICQGILLSRCAAFIIKSLHSCKRR